VNLTLSQRARALANQMLLASYVPDAETPAPGSAAWQLAVEQMARHFVHLFHTRKHELLRSGPPPAMPTLSPRAATRALLLKVAKEVA
jgi:hypothetical protein